MGVGGIVVESLSDCLVINVGGWRDWVSWGGPIVCKISLPFWHGLVMIYPSGRVFGCI